MKRLLLFIFCVMVQTASVRASEHVGTLTQLEGLVQIFSHPSSTLPSAKAPSGTLALFEGQYYLVSAAKPGDVVENGNIVRTVPGAKARVVFENGDQYQVGSGTAYRVSWDVKAADRAKLQAKIDLMYGKFRGVVSKDGPRKKMLLRTPVAVMGVRGTDFFVEENAKTGETEFTIIRGAVEVTPTAQAKDAPTPKTIEVKSGYSAVISEGKPAPAAAASPGPDVGTLQPAKMDAKVELRQTAQDELQAIQKTSVITSAPTKDAPVSKDVAKKVESLEKKALESTLNEIREYQPELHAKLMAKSSGMATLEGVNAESVNALMPTAPKLSPQKRRKPVFKDLDSSEDSQAYDKYFKNVE